MPQASAGNVISSSTQVGADVILTGNIKDGEIVNADLSATAAIAATKVQALSVGANGGVIPSTGIINAHLSGSAGITDANLATIATAGKVSGAALTLLANIPSGAGVIPTANIGTTIQEWALSDTIIASLDTEDTVSTTSPTKVKEVVVTGQGALRITIDGKSANASYTYQISVYRNGSSVTLVKDSVSTVYETTTVDTAGWKPGDLLQIYLSNTGSAVGAYCRNLKIKGSPAAPFSTINSN